MPQRDGILIERRRQKGVPLKIVFAAIGSSSVKQLQIGTDLLLIITSTGDEFSGNINIDDLDRPSIPIIRSFIDYFATSDENCDEVAGNEPRQSAYEILASDVDFSS